MPYKFVIGAEIIDKDTGSCLHAQTYVSQWYNDRETLEKSLSIFLSNDYKYHFANLGMMINNITISQKTD